MYCLTSMTSWSDPFLLDECFGVWFKCRQHCTTLSYQSSLWNLRSRTSNLEYSDYDRLSISRSCASSYLDFRDCIILKWHRGFFCWSTLSSVTKEILRHCTQKRLEYLSQFVLSFLVSRNLDTISINNHNKFMNFQWENNFIEWKYTKSNNQQQYTR